VQQAREEHATAPESRAVDVVILSLNRIEDTIAAISSALEQKGVSKHIWIVDQASDARQHARLQAFVRGKPVVVKSLRQNVGVSAGRNIASRMGGAPYIVALDNDAVFNNPLTLERAIAHLEADPVLGAVGFRILNYFSREDDVSSWVYHQEITHHARKEFPAAQFVGAGYAMRRAAFEASGGYDDELFFACEELDLSYRILNAGYKIKYVPDAVVLHKISPECRVQWREGRYYYTVRNRLYIHWKYGATFWRFARSATGFLMKGAYNGLLAQTLSGLIDAIRLCRKFDRSAFDRSLYVLRQDVKDYIRECNPRDQASIWDRLRRHTFSRLPSLAFICAASPL
jgi:GT2 family glycosyltransferase